MDLPKRSLTANILLLLNLLILISNPAHSQNQTIDSLKKEMLVSTEDTVRIQILNILFSKYINTYPDSAILYVNQAKTIARKLDDWKLIANVHRNYSHVYYILSEFPKAINHMKIALEIYKKSGYEKGEAAMLGNIGLIYIEQGNYDTALEYYFKALKIDEAIENDRGIAIRNSNIGIVFQEKGNYPKALEYYFKALNTDERAGRKSGIAAVLASIGNIYEIQGEFMKAKEYLFRALEISTEINHANSVSKHLGTLGGIFMTEMNYGKALEFHLKALKLSKEIGNKNDIAAHLANIGIVYDDLHDFPKALEYYFKALEINLELKLEPNIATVLGNIGSLYTTTGEFDSAKLYLDSALTISKNLGHLSNIMDFELNFVSLYDTIGEIAFSEKHWPEAALNYELAFHQQIKYRKAKDTLFNNEKNKDIGKLEARHEWDMKTREKNRQLEIKHAAEKDKLERRNLLRYSFITLILVALIVSLFYSKRLLASFPERIVIAKKIIQFNKQNLALRLLFATVFLVFETINVYFDKDIEAIILDNVLYKTIISCLFASTVSLVYFSFEKQLQKKLYPIINQYKTEPNDKDGNSIHNLTIFIVGFGLFWFSLQTNNSTAALANPIGQNLITDSLITDLGKPLDDTSRIKTLNNLALKLKFSNLDSAITLSTKALMLCKKHKWKKGLAISFRNLGFFSRIKGEYNISLDYQEQAIEISRKLKDQKGIAQSLSHIAMIHNNKSNNPKALEFYLQAMRIFEDLQDKDGLVNTYGNIGIVYDDLINYEKALEYYSKALKISETNNNMNHTAALIGNIGVIYYNQGNFTLALEYYERAIELDKQTNNFRDISIHLGNIGIIYFDQLEYTKALEYYFKALKISKELGDKKVTANQLCYIGTVYKILGKFKKAEAYLENARLLGDSIRNIYAKMEAHAHLAELHDSLAQFFKMKKQWQKAARHFQTAFLYHSKYFNNMDTLYNDEKSKDIGKLEMKHEIEMAEFENNKKKETETHLAALKKEREDRINYMLIIIVGLVLLGVSLLLIRVSLPHSLLQIATTIPFLLLFETVIVFMDPYVESFANNDPAIKLVANFALALLLFPLHEKAERFLKMRFSK